MKPTPKVGETMRRMFATSPAAEMITVRKDLVCLPYFCVIDESFGWNIYAIRQTIRQPATALYKRASLADFQYTSAISTQ